MFVFFLFFRWNEAPGDICLPLGSCGRPTCVTARRLACCCACLTFQPEEFLGFLLPTFFRGECVERAALSLLFPPPPQSVSGTFPNQNSPEQQADRVADTLSRLGKEASLSPSSGSRKSWRAPVLLDCGCVKICSFTCGRKALTLTSCGGASDAPNGFNHRVFLCLYFYRFVCVSL